MDGSSRLQKRLILGLGLAAVILRMQSSMSACSINVESLVPFLTIAEAAHTGPRAGGGGRWSGARAAGPAHADALKAAVLLPHAARAGPGDPAA